MAGVWIPWVKGLTRRREVLQIASTLGLSRREAACCCMEIWEWCDDEGEFDVSRNCHVFVTDLSFLDELVGVKNFGQALVSVGWAETSDGKRVTFPALGQWVGKSARERVSAQKRKQVERSRKSSVTEMSRSERDESVTPSISLSLSSSCIEDESLEKVTIPRALDSTEFRTLWTGWLQHIRHTHGQVPSDIAQTQQLERLMRRGHDLAVEDLRFSLEKNARTVLDSTRDFSRAPASKNGDVARRVAEKFAQQEMADATL